MLLEQEVEITWLGNNKNYYIDKGYKFTKIYDKILVNVYDLMPKTAKIVKIKCDYCNNIIERSYRDVYKNRGKSFINKDCCISCRSLKVEEVKNTKKYMKGKSVGDKFPDLIEEWSIRNEKSPFEYSYGTDKKVWWICKCGYEWISRIDNRTGENRRGCPKCRNVSKGESKIKDFLELKNINYKRQFSFNNLLNENNNKLLIDFAIFENDKLKLLIEYDGEQHYFPNFGEEEFKITQYRDNIKNIYCKENNIDLLRIPYWEINNIEKILCNKLNIAI